MELFTKILPEGTPMYRGHARAKDAPLRSGMHVWFALTKDHARLYGEHVTTYQLTHPVTLLISCHHTFLHDFSFKVMQRYKKTMRALMPLGLTQMDFGMTLSMGLYDVRKFTTEEELYLRRTIDCTVGNFGHKHRCSKQTESEMFDDHMVNAMKEIYHESHHGYICPLHWASVHHAGNLTPEMCLFDAGRHVRRVPNNKKEKKGGGVVPPPRGRFMVRENNERRYYDPDMETWVALNPAH